MSHSHHHSHRLPVATALLESLHAGYRFATFRHDIMAAFVVSLIALPLSMALSIAVGLPPQHGIYTAVAAGIISALFGGSRLQVSGPTAAFVVILAPIVTDLGLRGIIWCQILAGVMLIIFGIAHLGRLISYVPYPVTTGFTAGIAVVLATLSLNDFLGLGVTALTGSFLHKFSQLAHALPSLDWAETGVGVFTLLLIVFSPRYFGKWVPGPIIGVAAGTLLALLLGQYGFSIETIGDRFSYQTPEGQTLAGIPPYLPQFHLPGIEDGSGLWAFPTMAEWKLFFGPALTIAILAALESLLSATVADSLSGGKRHNPNAELNGIGLGNLASAVFTGIPATGAIARTAANINAGGKTPLASAFHAALIMLYVWLLADYINAIPMTALAALLLFTAYRMSHVHQFITTLQVAPRSDVLVLLSCFGLTVLIDMVAGVTVGMVLAAFLIIQRMTELSHIELETSRNRSHHEPRGRDLPDGVLVYHLHGPLFFANVEKTLDSEPSLYDGIHTLVLDMEDVGFIDMSGLVALHSMLKSVADQGRKVVICCKSEVAASIRKHHEHMPALAGLTVVENLQEALALSGDTAVAQ